MRILLIEDDLNFCETLRFQLEQEAYEVDVCHDGRDGLDLFLQDAHDIVLLDRMLPTMNGLLVLQKARQAGISTPVILITALGELYDRIEGLDDELKTSQKNFKQSALTAGEPDGASRST